MQSHISEPWAWQLHATKPEPWQAGAGIVLLCAILCLWFASLAVRFTEGDAWVAASVWLLAMVVWLVAQIALGRDHWPERHIAIWSTILQAVLPVIASLAAVLLIPSLRDAALAVAAGITFIELVAIHVLRLAAWGTIRKYRQGQLPRYFYLFGSLPDFGFAVVAVALTGALFAQIVEPAAWQWLVWNIIGAAAFLGAAITMYFGVPGSIMSHRWARAARGLEAPTLLPFRWPMNLAPAFCGPAFWLAHALFIAKVALP